MAAIASRSRRSLPHGSIEIVRGEPVSWHGSIFTAQVAYPVTSVAEATRAIAAMRQQGHAAAADHNMTAYRVKKIPKGLDKAYDDDGEAHGGQRLLGCLTKLDACNVAVMVSRVYGGVNIGKRRFELIQETARTLLEEVAHVPGRGIQQRVSTVTSGS